VSDPGLLRVEGLGRRFGGVEALADVTFSAAGGQVTAVIGPNGAGKTTLFNLIAGVTAPSRGRVRLAGRDVTALQPFERVRLGLARTFQNLQVFRDLTVLENVMIGRHARTASGLWSALVGSPAARREERAIRARSHELLERVGLGAVADRPAGALSFGQMKLVEVARALACEPRLLLLDEPAAGLPHAEAERLGALALELAANGLTILLVEHNVRLVLALSHHVVVLDHGRLIAEGEPAEIRRDPAVLAAYLGDDAHA
jgi:branched-chain amino acid transport system ATP-binding protein